MSKLQKIMIASLVLLLALLSYLEASEPQELNWSPSYSAVDRIPLGARVLYENLQEQELKVEEVNIPPFEFLNDSTISGTYFFLNNRLQFDDNELDKLFSWIERGNTAFIIAESIGQNLQDTLNLELQALIPRGGISSKPLLNLTDEKLQADKAFLLDREFQHPAFAEYDTLSQQVLGVSQLFRKNRKITDPKVNFLRDSIGKGAIYIHSTPKAFSNYFLLDDENYKYAERALAYIPAEKTLFWDSYYKTGKTFNTSPLFVILNSKPLKWSYYFLITGAILFVIFEGKRKQRPIPVREPLPNRTFDFTRTIAGLYLDRKDYRGIISKKITLFLDYVRSHYRISTEKVDEHFYERLASMSDNSPAEVKKLWQLMDNLKNKQEVHKEDLLRLNKGIKAFKKGKNGK